MILKGILKSYDGGTHQATVQIVGSLSTWLSGIPVSHGIAAADMVAGRNVAVLTPDPAKPGDSVVIALWAAATAPSGGGGGTKIEDADSDTSVDVEETPDDDNIVMTVEGTEAFRMYSSGVIDLAKQATSGAERGAAAGLWLPAALNTRVMLDTPLWDIQSELNLRVVTGAADATEANKLHDADGGFASTDVGAWLHNTTDDTYTQVTGYVDSGELDLAANIMANGEGYDLYHSVYTCAVDGRYLCIGVASFLSIANGKRIIIQLRKNGAIIGSTAFCVGGVTSTNAIVCMVVTELLVDDYVELRQRHDDTVKREGKSQRLYIVKVT